MSRKAMMYHAPIDEREVRRIATNHENTLIDVGSAIRRVAEEK